MIRHNVLSLAACALALGGFGGLNSAHAQGAPFTIRRPPDGAHVREKVRIEIPRGSIGPGGFVAFYLDSENKAAQKFLLAVAPEEEDDTGKPFTYLWDTKGTQISDGEHTIRAVLYEPAGGPNHVAVNEKGSTEIHVVVENKIKPGPDVPTSFLLRYKFHQGALLKYDRTGKSVVVGSGSEAGNITSDIELLSSRSKLDFAVEDVRFDPDAQNTLALVRNKLTELSVLQSGQETRVDPTALSESMYQELLPEGRVHYETGAASGLLEFLSQGLPVNNTLELPLLPTLRVSVGDTWSTPNQRLDIPGLPPILQPLVNLENKLVDLEYEQGRPCVKIHQTYNGSLNNLLGNKVKAIPFGSIEITSPTISYSRDIFVAYDSGTLVKTERSLTIKGRTTSPLGLDTSSGPGAAGPGAQGFPGGASMNGKGRFGAPGAMGPGMGGSGGRMMPGAMGGAGGMRGPGMGGSGGRMMPGAMGGGGGFPGGIGGAQEPDHAVTVKSISDTEIISASGLGGGSSAPKKSAAPIHHTGKSKKRSKH